MSIRLKTLILVLIMGVGAFGGAPLSASGTENSNEICPMKCCKKKAASKEEHSKETKSFCRLISCQESIPSAPGSSTSTSVIAGFVDKTESFGFYHTVAAKPRAPGLHNYESHTIPTVSVRFYVRHNSLLI